MSSADPKIPEQVDGFVESGDGFLEPTFERRHAGQDRQRHGDPPPVAGQAKRGQRLPARVAQTVEIA